jgi:TonB family protein
MMVLGFAKPDGGCTMSDSWKECEGQVVDADFTLLQHLGGSDHSVVFLTQRGKNKPEKAAIKFIQADPAKADLQLSRWKQAAQISHPNLIKLFETGRCHLAGMDLLYVVMEYAQENLAQFLPERALSAAETRDMLEPFIETLIHLHGKGFVHGRIKPGNILAIDDQLKLSSDSLMRIGESQISGGAPDAYTAPESAGGAGAAGDVWSLGITLVETLTQRVPERTEQQDPQVPDSVPQPFLDIARHSLRCDPKSRWTVAEISARLNPPAVASAPKASAPAIPDPIKPAAPKPAAAAPGTVGPAGKIAAPAKPADSIDPLSVPLSTVPPLPPSMQHTLENQVAGRKASYRSYYIVIAVLVALTLGAMLAIPELRDHQTEPDTTSAPAHPAVQPDAPLTPAKIAPPVVSKPQPNSPQKQSTPPADRALQGPAQRSALQPPPSSVQDSMTPASERQFMKKDQPSTDSEPTPVAPSPAPVRSDSAAAAIVPSGPVTQGEVLNQVLPEVSARSRSTIHGTVRVVVKVHVDDSGNVTGVEPATSPSRFFADAAVQAAKRWDFAPAKVADHAVASEWLLRFDFTQNDTKVLPSQTKP